ncbi:MAG: hypothetical protein WCI36_02530 [bacterium]
MENKQPIGEAQNSQKKEWYKNWWGIIIILIFLPIVAVWYIWEKTQWSKAIKIVATIVVVSLTFAVMGSNNSQQQAPAPIAQQASSDQTKKSAENPVQNNAPAQPATPTDQPSLEKSLATIVSSVSSEMNYKNISVDRSDANRPKGTQIINVGVDIKTFLDKNSLLRDTGKLSSSIFQAVYNVPAMKAYDVVVSYYGDTTDRYGKTQSSIALAYSIDKPTYEKINWQNFDQSKFCDFLNNENKITGLAGNTSCNLLADIK